MEDEADLLDCLLDAHVLKERATVLSDEDLVKTIINLTIDIEMTDSTMEHLDSFFSRGELSPTERYNLELCYVLVCNTYCVDPSGDIYETILQVKRGDE
jgi:hypothetical protein